MKIQDNISKARELGNINARQYRHNYGGDEFVFSNEECMQSALEMAKWKDRQFEKTKQNFLEKCKMWLIEHSFERMEEGADNDVHFHFGYLADFIEDMRKLLEEQK